jgi:hypothetical protein
VDAAKHIGQDDLDAIYSRLHRTKDGVKPYWALEVFGGGPGILSPQAFTSSGDVLGLDGVKQIRDAFKSYPAEHVGSIATLEVFGAGSGLTPSAKTLSFVDNHDTERNGDARNYKDGARFLRQRVAAGRLRLPADLPAQWVTDSNASPPSTANGLITDTDCSRLACTIARGILGMVGWNNYVGSARGATSHRRRQRDRLQQGRSRVGSLQQRRRPQQADHGADRASRRHILRSDPREASGQLVHRPDRDGEQHRQRHSDCRSLRRGRDRQSESHLNSRFGFSSRNAGGDPRRFCCW